MEKEWRRGAVGDTAPDIPRRRPTLPSVASHAKQNQ